MKWTCCLIFLLLFQLGYSQKLPNGHFLVQLDKKYKNLGVHDYEFTLDNEKFLTKIADKPESLEINWLNDTSFIVKGLTEPINPNPLEQEVLKKTRMSFQITKEEKNVYYFRLGEPQDEYPIYSGKFVKVH